MPVQMHSTSIQRAYLNRSNGPIFAPVKEKKIGSLLRVREILMCYGSAILICGVHGLVPRID